MWVDALVCHVYVFSCFFFFFFQPEAGIPDKLVTGVQTCALPICFATPVVSAAAAIVRQYFVEGRYPSGKRVSGSRRHPSAALIKAVLLNSTEKTTQSPDRSEERRVGKECRSRGSA